MIYETILHLQMIHITIMILGAIIMKCYHCLYSLLYCHHESYSSYWQHNQAEWKWNHPLSYYSGRYFIHSAIIAADISMTW